MHEELGTGPGFYYLYDKRRRRRRSGEDASGEAGVGSGPP